MDTKFKRENPWKGLQSYQENDTIYGRDEEIRALYTKILYNTQTVVYGKSGIGKSSIINAGIVPRAKLDDLLPVRIRLAHTTKREQTATTPYVEQIRLRMKEEIEAVGGEMEEIVSHKDGHAETLWELMHRHRFWKGEGESRRRIIPMLLLDQFEEIFTLEVDAKRVNAFFEELADLLNEVKPEYLSQTYTEEPTAESTDATDVSSNSTPGSRNVFSRIANKRRGNAPEYLDKSDFHIVITLREDFLSFLERHTTYIPVMKQNRFALLPLNEEQARKIIMEPIEELIQKDVAKEIIQKVTGREDFDLDGIPEIEVDAALLSLYMEQLFERKEDAASNISSELVVQYSDDIIKNFYESSIEGIPEETLEYLENELITNAKRRNNVARIDLLMGGVAEDDLDRLIERKVLRQFSYGGDLRIEFIHDILCPVVNDRIEHREQLAREREEKRRQEEERRALEAKALAEKKAMEEEAALIKERNKKRIRTIIYIATAIVAVVLAFVLRDYNDNKRVYEEYYAEFKNLNGWPVGIGEKLSKEERARTPLYYRLSHRGRKNGKNRHTDVEIMSSNELLPNSCRLAMLEWADEPGTDRRAAALNDILCNVAKIRYSANESSKEISKEELLDQNGDVLMTMSYFHISPTSAWLLFYTSSGENMKIRENGLDRLKLSWDSSGQVKSLMYYDAQGVQQDIVQGSDIKGYLWDYIGTDTVVRYALNEYGLPTAGIRDNTTLTIMRGDYKEIRHSKSTRIGDPASEEVPSTRGFSKSVCCGDTLWLYEPGATKPTATRLAQRDPKGNIVQWHTTGMNLFGFPAYINRKYHRGLLTEEEWLTADKKPCAKDSLMLYKWIYGYDENGSLTEERRMDSRNKLAYHFKIASTTRSGDTITTRELLDLRRTPTYVMQVDSTKATYSSTTFFGDKHAPLNQPVRVGEDSLLVHRIVTVRNGDETVSEYYKYDSLRVTPLPTELNDYGKAVSYFRRIEQYDATGNLTSLRLENERGQIVKSMMYFIQNGQRIGRAVKGITGNAVRCDKWEEDGFLYYKFYYNFDFEGNYSGLMAVDEWEHRSAIWDGFESYLNLNWTYWKGKYAKLYQGEHDRSPIFEEYVFKNYNQVAFVEDTEISDMEMPYVHVLSAQSSLYNRQKGLLDGDRIIAFGSWGHGQPVSAFKKEWNRVMENAQTVEVTVLRPTANAYERLEFSLPCTTAEQQYIEYHILHLTKDEKAFLQSCLQ